MSAEPAGLLQSLARAAPAHALHMMLGVPFSLAAAQFPASCTITTYGAMGSAGQLARSRAVRFSPLHYSRAGLVYEQGAWRCDVALVSLARARDGRLYLGAAHGPALAAARRARHVIAEVNAQAPCVACAAWPHDIAVSAMVEVDHAPAPQGEATPGAIEHAIGRQVAALVPDGACLQVGIGSLPSATLAALHSQQHLGVHSGMWSDQLQALFEAGVIDHSRKTRDAGVAVVGAVLGSDALYRVADGNPAICLREPGYTHDAAVVASIDDFFSLNSAVEVDLLGNVNAEALVGTDGRWRHVGGVGGLPDFVRAARLACRGQSVIALPSRTPHRQPRIVTRLSGPCTLAASDTDLVVTEHGVARLRDASLDQRVQRMLAIADPADRDTLAAGARAMGLA